MIHHFVSQNGCHITRTPTLSDFNENWYLGVFWCGEKKEHNGTYFFLFRSNLSVSRQCVNGILLCYGTQVSDSGSFGASSFDLPPKINGPIMEHCKCERKTCPFMYKHSLESENLNKFKNCADLAPLPLPDIQPNTMNFAQNFLCNLDLPPNLFCQLLGTLIIWKIYMITVI